MVVCGVDQHLLGELHIGTVGHGVVQVQAVRHGPAGDVHYRAVDDRAVRHDDVFQTDPVLEPAVQQSDLLHLVDVLAVDHHHVPALERTGGQQVDAAEELGEGVLGTQGDGHSGYARTGDYRHKVESQCAQQSGCRNYRNEDLPEHVEQRYERCIRTGDPVLFLHPVEYGLYGIGVDVPCDVCDDRDVDE